VQQKQVSAAPNQKNNHLLAVEKTGHKLGEVVAGTVEEDLGNEEVAGIHKAEVQQEDPTAEDPKACIHLLGVDCSYLEDPLRYDSHPKFGCELSGYRRNIEAPSLLSAI
jgi:proteasome lid subunit RPN8/RPN11